MLNLWFERGTLRWIRKRLAAKKTGVLKKASLRDHASFALETTVNRRLTLPSSYQQQLQRATDKILPNDFLPIFGPKTDGPANGRPDGSPSSP